MKHKSADVAGEGAAPLWLRLRGGFSSDYARLPGLRAAPLICRLAGIMATPLGRSPYPSLSPPSLLPWMLVQHASRSATTRAPAPLPAPATAATEKDLKRRRIDAGQSEANEDLDEMISSAVDHEIHNNAPIDPFEAPGSHEDAPMVLDESQPLELE